VLLQFVTSIVRQLVVDVQKNVFLHPFAFHSCIPFCVAAELRSAGRPGAAVPT
jgi:hypothetical protein